MILSAFSPKKGAVDFKKSKSEIIKLRLAPKRGAKLQKFSGRVTFR